MTACYRCDELAGLSLSPLGGRNLWGEGLRGGGEGAEGGCEHEQGLNSGAQVPP